MNNTEIWIIIGILGISTLFLRAIFLFTLPQIINHPVIRKGMDSVPASMLVALVIPFILFVDQTLDIFRPEVCAIVLSIPIIHLTKRYSYGLIVAIIIYSLLNFFL